MKNMIFPSAEVEQIILLFQQRNQKINTNPKINKKNKCIRKFKWKKLHHVVYKEIKIELGDRGMLNYVTVIPPTTITQQWK